MTELKRKDKIICLRCYPEELKEIDAQATAVDLNRSAYLWRKIRGLPVMPAKVPPINWQTYRELKEIVAELRAIGNNINQIAKGINTANQHRTPLPDNLPSDFTLAELSTQLDLTQNLIRETALTIIGVNPTTE